MAAGITIPTTFIAKDKFTGVVKKMTMNVKRFGKSSAAAVQRFNTKLNNSLNKMSRFGALAGGLAIGTLFTAAIKGNIDFNDSLASVSAITGATGEALAELESKAMKTAKETKKSGAEVLKAYELVGSAKPELLQNAAALDEVTRSVITLSKASRMDLEQSTRALTDVMNQFNLAGEESANVIDVLAAGAKFGSAAIPQISEAIVQFGTVAKQSNVSLMESVAAVEVFAAKGIKGAEAGTKMRNVLTTLATAKALPKKALDQLSKFGVDLDVVSDKTLPLNERLKEMSKVSGDATAMVKIFGKENQGAGAILLENIPLLENLTKNVKETGVAQAQATANTQTLAFSLEAIKTSFINATTATNSNNKGMKMIMKTLGFVADNMETIITVIGVLLGAFITLKVVSGIITAVNYATKAWTTAQWLLNVALNANPIGLIVIGIAALIGVVALIINYYDSWGASLSMLLGPFGLLISIIQSFRRNWEMVKEAFANGGLLEGLKAIGRVLLDAVLMPIQQLLSLLANIPGLGGLAGKGADMIAELRGSLGVDTGATDSESDGVLPSTAQATNSEVIQRSETKNSLEINVKDKGNNVESVRQNGGDDIGIKTSSTVGVS